MSRVTSCITSAMCSCRHDVMRNRPFSCIHVYSPISPHVVNMFSCFVLTNVFNLFNRVFMVCVHPTGVPNLLIGLLMYAIFIFLLADEPGGVDRLYNVRASVEIEYDLTNCMHVYKF